MTEDAIAGLDFLVGTWRGAGVWGGAPFTTEATWGRRGANRLTGLVVSTAAGRTRSETIVIEQRAGTLTADVSSGPGPAQRFEVQELAAGERYRLVFTPPAGSGLVPQRWTLERTADGYAETFEIARSGAFERSVECAYRPARDTR